MSSKLPCLMEDILVRALSAVSDKQSKIWLGIPSAFELFSYFPLSHYLAGNSILALAKQPTS